MEILITITIWLIGSVLGYILLRLDFRKIAHYHWGQVVGQIIVSLLFSWVVVIIGLIINAINGNFGTIKFKSEPPKWL